MSAAVRVRDVVAAAEATDSRQKRVLPRALASAGVSRLGWLPAELHPVTLRLARADLLAHNLAKVALEWSRGPDDAGALTIRQIERTPGLYDVEVASLRPVPPVASMLFSEAVHHLRSAVDNVVFHLVEKWHGQPLTAAQERSVTMLIYDGQTDYERKVKRLAGQGLEMFGPQEQLGRRLASLQPFNDDASVPSLSPQLAKIMRVESVSARPLSLLRDYSNWDKHRAIRLAAAKLLVQRSDDWRRSVSQGMREINVGTVLEVVTKGVLTPVEISAALHVQRPNGCWVGFGPELDGIARHISDIVIPTLVTGLALPDGLPVDIDLSDNGQTLHERAEAAGTMRAHERTQDLMREALAAAEHQEMRWTPTVNHDDVT